MTRRGQASIFVIIAIVILGGILVYLIASGNFGVEEENPELKEVFDYYQGCIEQESKNALELAGTQGGYVDVPEYAPGSEYAPFSSQLNFLGFSVPYWYYVSGNGVIKEQVPSKAEIERQIEEYVAEGLEFCEFERFYSQGYLIERENPEVRVVIEEQKINVDLNGALSVSKGETFSRRNSYHAEIKSKFGKFYNIAREIYDEQKEKAFFENYAVDVLRLYAPVDGVEIQCAPKIWSTENVINELKNGLEENFGTIKFKGNYYDIKDDKRNYFVVDKGVDEAVNVMYSKNWATKIEISGEGADEEIIIAEPIGTQEGLGVMGFCYIPYHFVYDVSFPVLIQVYNNDEMFQFPVVIIVNNNVPREVIFSEISEEEEFDLCDYETQEVEINLYDINLNSVEGNLSYECFNQRCRLGQTDKGKFVGSAPACVNGFIHVRAEGYSEKKELFSSNDESFAEIVLDREYELNVNVSIGSAGRDSNAFVSFVRKDGKATTAVIPESNKIKLSEGSYDISVYVYGNSSVVLPATSKTECVDVPKEGLLGFFGGTREECFDIKIPESKIEYALIGGGKSEEYLLESELVKGNVILSVDSLPRPNSIDDLQKNYDSFEGKRARVEFYER